MTPTEIKELIESYNKDDNCERFKTEELLVLLSIFKGEWPIVEELELRAMVRRTVNESDFACYL